VLAKLASLLIFLAPPPGAPVCLEGRLSVEREYHKSAGVFIGRVIAGRAVPESKDYLEGTVYSVRVEEVLHGEVPDTVEVFSENTSGRFPMDVESRYLLFVYRNLGRVMVDNCGNSGPLSSTTEVLKAVRRLRRESGHRG
jgi:hypothetical protein